MRIVSKRQQPVVFLLYNGIVTRNGSLKSWLQLLQKSGGHFRQVVAELKKRGLKLGRQRKDVYVNRLLEFQYKGGDEGDRMLDKLLTNALIEARSCERFKRLSEGLEDSYMRDFYRRFMESEAGHYQLFIELAEFYFDPAVVRKRWNEWLVKEAEIMHDMELRGDRIH